MKKVSMMVIPVVGMLISGCASTQNLSEVEKNALVWEYAGDLPAQKGFDENVGVAGLLQGTIGNYVVVGGGANFPVPLEKGGSKVTHKDIYLLKEADGKLVVVDQISLSYPIGYGASVNIPEENAIYYLGGSPDAAHEKDVLKVMLDGQKIKTEVVAQLPAAFQNGVAQYRDGFIYYGVGKCGDSDGKVVNSNRFFAFNMKTKKTEELKSFPGEARQQTVGQILGSKFYVFSGGSNVAYVDGYAYDFASKTWQKVADVVIDGEKVLLLGANSVKITDDKMLVIGGFNYKLWNDANKYLSTLKGDELKSYREDYFGAEPPSYNWNKKELIYNAANNSWSVIGEVPFNAPCGHALVKVGETVYCINGEIKPGVRTDRMFKGIVVAK